MGKDWLNDKVGTNLPGSNSLTGKILFQHHRAPSNQPDQPGVPVIPLKLLHPALL